MKSTNEIITLLNSPEGLAALSTLYRGLEREGLRTDLNGRLATDPHPKILGSTLTHSRITTDYSESMLEFITPVETNIDTLLQGLTETHAYTVQHLDNQQLWPLSMPCYVDDVADIPIADYGSSNEGKFKTLYRKGLTHRYGALMQIISGVHFNFSVSESLWDILYNQTDKSASRKDFISASYFNLIRNYRRLVWILPYLFGASPALCSSFIKYQKTNLPFQKIGKGTLYLPYATSLRMSDLGYTSKEQSSLALSYNSVQDYIEGLQRAAQTPSKEFADLGVKVNGEYRQLNSNILQIENEFYSPIRAKRVIKKTEKPSIALAKDGVQYIEVRALDVNPFSAIGVDENQIRFLDLFLLHCLFSPSKPTTTEEEKEIAANLKAVVIEGRKPDLMLAQDGQAIGLQVWIKQLFTQLADVANLLDKATANGSQKRYQLALDHWMPAVLDPNKTLSAQVLSELISHTEDHNHWTLKLANQYRQQLLAYPLSSDVVASYEAEAEQSLITQQLLEADDKENFCDYLTRYFETTH